MAATTIAATDAAVNENRYEIAVVLDPVTGDYEINVVGLDRDVIFIGYAPTRLEAEERAHEYIWRQLRRGGAP